MLNINMATICLYILKKIYEYTTPRLNNTADNSYF